MAPRGSNPVEGQIEKKDACVEVAYRRTECPLQSLARIAYDALLAAVKPRQFLITQTVEAR